MNSGQSAVAVFICCGKFLQALGPQHSLLLPDLLHDLAIEVSLFPETCLGVVILPNTPIYGQGGPQSHKDRTLIKQAQQAVLEKLQESSTDVEVEQVIITYDPNSMWSPWRKLHFEAAVVFSSKKDANGVPLSKFANSTLVQRSAVPGAS